MVLNRAQGLKKKSQEVSTRKNNNRQRYNKKCRRGGGFRPPPALLGLKSGCKIATQWYEICCHSESLKLIPFLSNLTTNPHNPPLILYFTDYCCMFLYAGRSPVIPVVIYHIHTHTKKVDMNNQANCMMIQIKQLKQKQPFSNLILEYFTIHNCLRGHNWMLLPHRP